MASGAFRMELLGSTGLIRRLQALDDRLQGPILRRAIVKAAKPIETQARQQAARETGLLKASMGHKTKVYKRSNRFGSTASGFNPKGTVVVIIGARMQFTSARRGKLSGKQALRQPAYYAHLVEKGTVPHSIKTRVNMKLIRRGNTPFNLAGSRTAARRAAVQFFYQRDKAKGFRTHPGSRAQPFLVPALESNKNAALNIMINELRNGVNSA